MHGARAGARAAAQAFWRKGGGVGPPWPRLAGRMLLLAPWATMGLQAGSLCRSATS